jgi:hypothetical protein
MEMVRAHTVAMGSKFAVASTASNLAALGSSPAADDLAGSSGMVESETPQQNPATAQAFSIGELSIPTALLSTGHIESLESFSNKAMWPSWLVAGMNYLEGVSTSSEWVALLSKFIILEGSLAFSTTVGLICMVLSSLNEVLPCRGGSSMPICGQRSSTCG